MIFSSGENACFLLIPPRDSSKGTGLSRSADTRGSPMIRLCKRAVKYMLRRTLFRHDLAHCGSLANCEYDFLRELVGRANQLPGDFVEIGTLFGSTAQRLAAWKAPGKKVIAVDQFSWNPWVLSPAEHERITANNLYYLTTHNHLEMVKADKNDFYRRSFAVPPALAFLDAVHTYEETRRDILWARQAGVGIICGHDYDHPGVVRAVAGFGGPEQVVGSVWVLQARSAQKVA